MNRPPVKEPPVRQKLSIFMQVFGCVILGIILTGAVIVAARYLPVN